jgi:hypothetical protein
MYLNRGEQTWTGLDQAGKNKFKATIVVFCHDLRGPERTKSEKRSKRDVYVRGKMEKKKGATPGPQSCPCQHDKTYIEGLRVAT